jgi:hypothetical protein
MTGFLRKTFGAKDAAQATKEAAGVSAEAQREALEYLKQQEAAPSFYREQALGGLASLYGLPTYSAEGVQTPQFDISMLENSPLYQGIISGQQAGEEAILRNAAATGGLRSGNVQSALADFSSDLQNQALMTAYQDYTGGLRGLSGLESYAPQIAEATAGIGATQASGITGAAQARQQGQAAAMGTVLGGLQTGMKAFQAFSDVRLKTNVKRIGEKNGFPYYSWDWNDKAASLGLEGSSEGYMAHEVAEVMPEAISESQGYLQVNEGMLNG